MSATVGALSAHLHAGDRHIVELGLAHNLADLFQVNVKLALAEADALMSAGNWPYSAYVLGILNLGIAVGVGP